MSYSDDNLTNPWGNSSMPAPHGTNAVWQYVEMISVPVVCFVGTLLNLMAVGAFLSKPLRRISCCLYLATRSLAVFGNLISIFVAWSNLFSSLVRTDGICHMTVFLSYFCPFLSVWMVVIISFENFIRIAQPSRVKTLCNPKVAKSVIATFFVIGLAVYNFAIWTTGIIHGMCTHKYSQMLVILNYVDIALTMVAPLGLLIILVPLVALTAIHGYDRKKRLAAGRSSRPGTQDVKSTPEARVTHLLLAVSVVFLVLHIPFHAIRIKFFILQTAGSVDQVTDLDNNLHILFRHFYNFDTCISCAVYLIFGDNFRRVFCAMYFSRCQSRRTSNVSDVGSTGASKGIEISNIGSTSPDSRNRLHHQTLQQQQQHGSNNHSEVTCSLSLNHAANTVTTRLIPHHVENTLSPTSSVNGKHKTYLHGKGNTLICIDDKDEEDEDDVDIDEERQTKRGLLSTESVDV